MRHKISKTVIKICHRAPCRNLEKDEGRPTTVKFVRRQTISGLMAHKQSMKQCEDKIFVNEDITLLRAQLAKALQLPADIKSVPI